MFPSLQILLYAFSCTDVGTEPALLYFDSVECWSGWHFLYVATAVIGLLCYYPLSSFMFPLVQFSDTR